MVQKSKPPTAANELKRRGEPKRRGRPRAYEPEIALGKALDLFRKQGFAATSLDDLSERSQSSMRARPRGSADSS